MYNTKNNVRVGDNNKDHNKQTQQSTSNLPSLFGTGTDDNFFFDHNHDEIVERVEREQDDEEDCIEENSTKTTMKILPITVGNNNINGWYPISVFLVVTTLNNSFWTFSKMMCLPHQRQEML